MPYAAIPNTDSPNAEPAAVGSGNERAASFYVTGGTLPVGSASYVARRADTELYELLQSGDFCYVLNTRQMANPP